MRDRRKLAFGAAAALALVAAQHPGANLRILTHDVGDPRPSRFEVGLDLGLLAVSVLVTWTADRLARS